MPGERGLDLRVLTRLGGRVALHGAQPAQVSERHERGRLTTEMDHLVRPCAVRRLRAHAVHRTTSPPPFPAFTPPAPAASPARRGQSASGHETVPRVPL